MTEQTLEARVLDPSLMDRDVRPQDDFFRHVNGTWLREHPIPADRPTDGAFYLLRDLSEDRGRAIVEDAAAGRLEDPDAERIAIIYRQFMDEDAVEAAGGAPLAPELDAIARAGDHGALARVGGSLSRGTVSLFFSPYVNNDVRDASRYIAYLHQAGLGLPDESFYREDHHAATRSAYTGHVARALVLGGVVDEGAAAESAERVMAFETELAGHHWDSVKNRDPQLADNPRAWAQIVEQNPGFDWNGWALAARFDTTAIDTVNVDQPDFLAAACALWERTDLDVLKLWLARKVIDARSPLLARAFVEENFDFYSRTLAGTQELRPRWKRGLALVEGTLGEALGRLYVARHFPPESKARMEDLVARLLGAYRDSITRLDWMGEETKARALEKLASFTPKIGYPPKWRDYSALAVSAQATLVDNVRAAETHESDYEWSKLGRPVDRDEWFMTPQTVNAYYNPTMNEIVFPAAILQPPFFDPEADDAVNFGGIGAVIGHEIGHGFDDQGSRFDAAGNLRNWWSDRDRAEFEARTRALIAQYDACTPAQLEGRGGGLHVNGALTIGENIGDLGGLAIAWKAWAATLRDRGIASPADAPVIDGLTGPQRFFLSWARIWRGKSRDEYAVQMLSVDPHSPVEFRCNGVLRNLDAFADTYGLRPGDALWLEPEERVRIW
ncbi:MAG: peptidase M13 [Actinomyces sp.]|jgi:putative endopeptidase|nr:M13-type metalloendopeptidase [Actinomyces sp.]MCI1642899.1 peptidase M13 [Actinomyces sp.]MCI1662722.1 peptidase M13 [Actinomyces sp.]MCI1691367.1 peptidase M13 [Actinomyces sp.]MCI1788510.1 peptidase M13 [Actinomyces sp.]MCI1831050.1 peptidase M13 [Actinomyces sp.]